MKDVYPSYDTIRQEWLVAPDHQPEYLELEGSEVTKTSNVGWWLTERQLSLGRGGTPALIHHEEGTVYTFADLAEQSARLANVLVAKGVRPGDRIAIRLSNRPEAVITAVAAWRAGAVVVPTPAQARAEELRFLLEDTMPRVLVVYGREGFVDGVASSVAGSAVREVIVVGDREGSSGYERWEDLLARASATFADRELSSDGLAVIWHTGGTTGVPKACYHTHRRYLQGSESFGRATGVRAGQRWAAAAPIGHALGFLHHTAYTLAHGATSVMIEGFSRPESVLTAISTHGVETFTAIAATWARMLKAMADAPELDRLSSLRRGYAMWQSASSREVRSGWEARGLDLMNNFGSTAFATWILVPRAGEKFTPASMGRAAPGYRIETIDPAARSVVPFARGMSGRMVVRGVTGLTYWRRPEQQERDVVEGWTLVDDLITIGEDGNADYLGRTDFMISTAGYKVAPVEVEQVLARHVAVRECAVIGTPDAIRQEVVTAFVAVTAGVSVSDALKRELQEHCKANLAPYKYPRRIEFIDALPRDPVGKVQPRKLKELISEGRAC
jgi:2-aminobenzoate-CoA ligase